MFEMLIFAQLLSGIFGEKVGVGLRGFGGWMGGREGGEVG